MGGFKLSLPTNDSVDDVPLSACASFFTPADEILRNGARNREKRDLEGEDLEIRGAGTEAIEGKGMAILGSLAIAFFRAVTWALSLSDPSVHRHWPGSLATYWISFFSAILLFSFA